MLILAIDPGAHLGWSLQGTNTEVPEDSGIYELGIGGVKEPLGLKLLRMQTWLEGRLLRNVIGLIAVEHAARGSHNLDRLEEHGCYRGVIELVAARAELDVQVVNPSMLKSWATGSGRAQKSQMMSALKTMTGLEIRDDNEADAIWIGLFARQTVTRGPIKPLNPKPPKRRRSKRDSQQRFL